MFLRTFFFGALRNVLTFCQVSNFVPIQTKLFSFDHWLSSLLFNEVLAFIGSIVLMALNLANFFPSYFLSHLNPFL